MGDPLDALFPIRAIQRVIASVVSTLPFRPNLRFRGTGVTVTDVANEANPAEAYTDVEITAGEGGTPGAGSITDAMLADMPQDRFKGRASAGDGPPQNLTAAQVRAILNVADGATALSLTNAAAANVGTTAAAGDATTAARANHVHILGDGAVSAAAKLADSVVTLAKMANVAAGNVLGRLSGTGAPQAIAAVAAATADTIFARDANGDGAVRYLTAERLLSAAALLVQSAAGQALTVRPANSTSGAGANVDIGGAQGATPGTNAGGSVRVPMGVPVSSISEGISFWSSVAGTPLNAKLASFRDYFGQFEISTTGYMQVNVAGNRQDIASGDHYSYALGALGFVLIPQNGGIVVRDAFTNDRVSSDNINDQTITTATTTTIASATPSATRPAVIALIVIVRRTTSPTPTTTAIWLVRLQYLSVAGAAVPIGSPTIDLVDGNDGCSLAVDESANTWRLRLTTPDTTSRVATVNRVRNA